MCIMPGVYIDLARQMAKAYALHSINANARYIYIIVIKMCYLLCESSFILHNPRVPISSVSFSAE